jgi:hypothetical protein
MTKYVGTGNQKIAFVENVEILCGEVSRVRVTLHGTGFRARVPAL